MALFIPGICGPHYYGRAVQAAADLIRKVGYGSQGGPWIPLGAAVHGGVTYVGNVGSGNVLDFTALGDTVNTAARLAQSAEAGEILLSDAVYTAVEATHPGLEARTVTLRGKDAPLDVHVLSASR